MLTVSSLYYIVSCLYFCSVNCSFDEFYSIEFKCIFRFLDVGRIVRDTEKESIRNRGCRVLANLCQTVACCNIIHEDHADIFSTIVSDLCKSTNVDCKVTYCRLIR